MNKYENHEEKDTMIDKKELVSKFHYSATTNLASNWIKLAILLTLLTGSSAGFFLLPSPWCDPLALIAVVLGFQAAIFLSGMLSDPLG